MLFKDGIDFLLVPIFRARQEHSIAFPLIAVAASHFPDIVRPVAGDRTGKVAIAVAEAVRQVDGAKDAVTARAALAGDAEKVLRLRSRLAEIAAASIRFPAEGKG